MATPGWWVLIGAAGTSDAEDERAGSLELQHSAGTGMMSARESLSETVMNSSTEPQRERGRSGAVTSSSEGGDFAQVQGFFFWSGALQRPLLLLLSVYCFFLCYVRGGANNDLMQHRQHLVWSVDQAVVWFYYLLS